MSLLKKSKILAIAALALSTAGCQTACPLCEPIALFCHWQTPLDCRMTEDDPSCFPWYEALDDSCLTALVDQAACRNLDVRLAAAQSRAKALETLNHVTADVAKTYIELRMSQLQSNILQQQIGTQQCILNITEGLAKNGSLNVFDQSDQQISLDALFVQQSSLELAIKKASFHLATLLSYAPGDLCDSLCCQQDLPTLPCCFPVGTPAGTVCCQSCRRQSAMNQKKILCQLEERELALATFHAEAEKLGYQEQRRCLKSDAYQSILDLYHRGQKGDLDLLAAYQAYLLEESASIQSRGTLLIDYVNLFH